MDIFPSNTHIITVNVLLYFIIVPLVYDCITLCITPKNIGFTVTIKVQNVGHLPRLVIHYINVRAAKDLTGFKYQISNVATINLVTPD